MQGIAGVTQVHRERSRMIKRCIEVDIVRKGLTFEQACEQLATELGVETETVKLAIAIANEGN